MLCDDLAMSWTKVPGQVPDSNLIRFTSYDELISEGQCMRYWWVLWGVLLLLPEVSRSSERVINRNLTTGSGAWVRTKLVFGFEPAIRRKLRQIITDDKFSNEPLKGQVPIWLLRNQRVANGLLFRNQRNHSQFLSFGRFSLEISVLLSR